MSHEDAGKVILSIMGPIAHKVEELKKTTPAPTDDQIDKILDNDGSQASFVKNQAAFTVPYNEAYAEIFRVRNTVPAGPDHDKSVEKAMEAARIQHGLDIMDFKVKLLLSPAVSAEHPISPLLVYEGMYLLAKTDMLQVRFPSKEWMDIDFSSEQARALFMRTLSRSTLTEAQKIEQDKRDAELAKNPLPSAPVAVPAPAPAGKLDAK